jgi:hypothetical protein
MIKDTIFVQVSLMWEEYKVFTKADWWNLLRKYVKKRGMEMYI